MSYVETEVNFIKYTDHKAGDVLLEDVFFTGTEENPFGSLNYLFKNKEGSIVKLPHAGSVKYAHEQGILREGPMYKVIFEGKGILEKGNYKGKEFNKIKILVDDSAEVVKGAAPTDSNSQDKLPF